MDGVKDFPDSFLAWVCCTTLVLSHLTLIDSGILGEFASVDEVKVIEE